MTQILSYFPNLTTLQKEQLSRLYDLYSDWNEKINVISRKDMDSFYEKHVLHSLAIAKVISFKPKTQILDVGTGGGFPGIPLAILFPECQFTLVDSIGKKITVVENVTEELNLKNVSPINSRAEKIDKKFDFVVSRAVTKMDAFTQWIQNSFRKESFNILKNGILYLKGGDLTEELQHFSNARLYEISNFYSEEFFETKKVVYIPFS
ncbi:MAG: 16S rRNA (guanine(527)-N(7))-methyltransferase RsmG [Flavobacteriales bacterium]|nr:16S rRNA (guanine(527)-N(7))-methyltransferase RsmG [Flavobacteriales bacterium]